MSSPIAPIAPEHLSAVLRLNAQYAMETSELDLAALTQMTAAAFLALQAGDGEDGFLIAFDTKAPYGSENYRWFQERYQDFAYVDRIIVAPAARGRGLARAFYEALFDRARQVGLQTIACEVNQVPPNPGSDAFHDRLGFSEVGRATLASNGKTVRHLMTSL